MALTTYVITWDARQPKYLTGSMSKPDIGYLTATKWDKERVNTISTVNDWIDPLKVIKRGRLNITELVQVRDLLIDWRYQNEPTHFNSSESIYPAIVEEFIIFVNFAELHKNAPDVKIEVHYG